MPPSPSSRDCSNLLTTAIRAARAAATVLTEYAHSGFRIDYKAAINLVTDADRRAEDRIVQTIISVYPEHCILAPVRWKLSKTESHEQSWSCHQVDL